jgi:cysteinyl-tRNA synthetase
VAAHYRSHVEFSFEALDEAAAGFRRIEHYLDRTTDVLGGIAAGGMPCADFVNAMNDDLGTPAAVAAIHEVVREGNKLLGAGDSPALRGNAASVVAMLGVLGLDPADPAWHTHGGGDRDHLLSVVDALVAGVIAERTEARAAKDFARADALRDRLTQAGVQLEDTPDGPKWSLG